MRDTRFVARHRAAAQWEAAAAEVFRRLTVLGPAPGGTYVGRRRASSAVQLQLRLRYATVVATAVLGAGVVALAGGHAPGAAGGTGTDVPRHPPVIVRHDARPGGDGTAARDGRRYAHERAVTILRAQAAEDRWTSPIAAHRFRLTSLYGTRWGERHGGVDLGAPAGAVVRAAHAGIVERAGWAGTYGYLVVIDHGEGVETYYAHNSALLVSAGDAVRTGEPISRVGNTGYSFGPHSHFEVRRDGRKIDPVAFLDGRGLDLAAAAAPAPAEAARAPAGAARPPGWTDVSVIPRA